VADSSRQATLNISAIKHELETNQLITHKPIAHIELVNSLLETLSTSRTKEQTVNSIFTTGTLTIVSQRRSASSTNASPPKLNRAAFLQLLLGSNLLGIFRKVSSSEQSI
jgi:hypothetical protein